MKNLLLLFWNTPPRKPDGLQQDIQVSDNIILTIFYSEKEVGALKKCVLHQRHPDKYPHTPLMLLVIRKESPSIRQLCPIRMKTLR